MNAFSQVPPGFRFHPTDEELVDYYLRKKVASKRIDLDVIKEVDLYKIEPWDLQELCRIGSEEQSDWYFFSHKDKKYPTGTRTNRATKAGFWKATGRDKSIYSRHCLIGMRKTLVFYKGRAPNGHKSDWIMHEYRLETNENGTPQEEGWAVCRVFKKRLPAVRKMGEYGSPCNWYEDQLSSFMPDTESPSHMSQLYANNSYHPHYSNCKQEGDDPHHLHNQQQQQQQHYYEIPQHHDPFIQLPQLESSNVPESSTSRVLLPYGNNDQHSLISSINNYSSEQVTDWRVLDKFVASQLSQEGDDHDQDGIINPKDITNYSIDMSTIDMVATSIPSSSSSQIEAWK